MIACGSLMHAQPTCPISYGATDSAKPNKLYLYFPAADDSSFPNYASLVSPAKKFDITQLSSYTGNATDLKNRVQDVVTDDYCEFNVKVFQTTTAPPSSFPRRVTVAIGTDANTSGGGFTWGQAQEVDLNDGVAVDFAREWGGTYQSSAGAAGGALNGGNSTLDRWAESIGGTAAHEAGHTFGLSHADGANMKSGEGAVGTSIMPQGSLITDEQRACCRRRFNDVTFSLLASNVGLSIQTMHNWNFTNPNPTTATKLQIEFLSKQSTMLMTWAYGGALSPWSTPVVSGPSGTQTLQGTTYNVFRITWSSAKAWSGGTAGQVPGGIEFHVGATFSGVDFNTPNPILVSKVTLFDASNNPLTLSPRMIGYDAGTVDASDGLFRIKFTNLDLAHPLKIKNIVMRELPVPVSIDSLVNGAKLLDWRGLDVLPWPVGRESGRGNTPGTGTENQGTSRLLGDLDVSESSSLTIGKLSQGRHVFDNFANANCKAPADRSISPDVNECVNGTNVDLFPATVAMVTASIVDENATYYDAVQKKMVTGPLESKLFYQFGGIHPDLNKNGVDDFLDIARGQSLDKNGDGVPDEVQKAGFHWTWQLWLLLILLLLLIVWLIYRKSRTV